MTEFENIAKAHAEIESSLPYGIKWNWKTNLDAKFGLAFAISRASNEEVTKVLEYLKQIAK